MALAHHLDIKKGDKLVCNLSNGEISLMVVKTCLTTLPRLPFAICQKPPKALSTNQYLMDNPV